MSLQKAHHTIDAVRRLIPNSLIFILDTMDRSFIYRSRENQNCVDVILSLDEQVGIEHLCKTGDTYTHEEQNKYLYLRKLGQNTFLGFCAEKTDYSSELLEEASAII